MNRQTLMFGLLFLLALACWQVLDEKPQALDNAKKEHFQPDFVAQNVVTREFDSNGRLTRHLESRFTEYFRSIDMAQLQEPRLTLYNQQGIPEWKISAKEGVWNVGDNAVLRNDIHVDGLLPDAMVRTIDTSYLELDLNSKDVRSNSKVIAKGDLVQTEGVGLKGNLDKRYFELLEQSHAIYFNQKR